MDSFLESISTHAKKIKYPHKRISIKFASVPESFHEVALNYIISNSKVTIYKETFKLDRFDIHFNDDYNAAIIIHNPITNQCFIIKQENVHFDNLNGTFIKESNFLQDVRLKEDYHYSNALNSLPERERKYIKTLGEKEKMFSSEMINSLENIKSYMKWIVKETNIINSTIDAEINYKVNPMDMDNQKRNFKGTAEERQWLNDPIKFMDRMDQLGKYESMYDIKASEIDDTYEEDVYFVKVFNVKNKIVLIMEPKEARKYTKIKYIDSDKITKEQAIKIAGETLSLNKEEITNQGDITRHTHTTIEEYRKLLRYILEDVDEGLRYSAIERIESAKENAKRIV